MAVLRFEPFTTAWLVSMPGEAARRWRETALAHPAIAVEYEVPGLAWVALRHGVPVAAAGIRPEFAEEGAAGIAGECWTLFEPGLSRAEWRQVLHKTRTVLREAERRGYRRLAAYVRTDLPFGHKLAELLGFEVEGLLRRWGPMDADTLLMARVRDRAEKREAA